ncbi:MAG: tyrosine-type recombinase/integrase [Bacteriovorax sp.]
MKKKKEEALKNYPGIYKLLDWNEKLKRWQDSGKYRSIRRVRIEGELSKKESCFFDSLEDAKEFRIGKLAKHETGRHHKNVTLDSKDKLRFAALLQEWKDFHYMTIDFTTRQTYDKKLPPLNYLSSYYVDEISPKVIDQMIRHWHENYPRRKTRFSFEKELDALKVVLNYYRKRVNALYPLPIFKEHYQAAKVVRRAKQPVRSLRPDDLGNFLRALKAQKNPLYFPLALTQFGLGLRIGEACGLTWDALDLERSIATIEQTIIWDQESWEPKIKSCPKNGQVRFLVIPEILVQELRLLKETRSQDTSLVFHAEGRPMIRKSIGCAYNRALKLCGVNYVSGTHLIRKTSATQANRITGDFHAVSLNLGHSSLDETQKYVEEVDEGKWKVARALDGVARAVLALPEKVKECIGGASSTPPVPHCPVKGN